MNQLSDDLAIVSDDRSKDQYDTENILLIEKLFMQKFCIPRLRHINSYKKSIGITKQNIDHLIETYDNNKDIDQIIIQQIVLDKDIDTLNHIFNFHNITINHLRDTLKSINIKKNHFLVNKNEKNKN